jgi:uncharacterized protein YbjT (DUF2867 family)
VLVTGAGGFIGGAIVEALAAAGHEVAACVRAAGDGTAGIGNRRVVVDLREATDEGAWRPLVAGIDAVVNCAGILREERVGDYTRIHHDAPLALARACREAGVRKFVQVSALGDEAGGEFIASKHRFDAALLALGVPATVIRPSVVVSARGSHGGTSLLRALAALPVVVFLPGDGEQKIQPVMREDLAAMVERCLAPDVASGRVLFAVGPDVMTLREFLGRMREWLGLPAARFVQVPAALVSLAVWMGERFGAGPLGATIGAMLERGNVAPKGAWEEAREATGIATRAMASAMSASPSLVQDRWHARLHLLRPVLLGIVAATWIASGVVGFAATPEMFEPIASDLGVPAAFHRPLVLATSALDVALGAALLTRWEGAALALMAISVVAYTTALGIASPGQWVEPTGGLLKNFALLALLAVLGAMRGKR